MQEKENASTAAAAALTCRDYFPTNRKTTADGDRKTERNYFNNQSHRDRPNGGISNETTCIVPWQWVQLLRQSKSDKRGLVICHAMASDNRHQQHSATKTIRIYLLR